MKKDGVGGVNGIGLARGITVSPDGNHLYVSGYSEDAIVTFTRNSSTGALTFVEMKKNGFGIGWARQVTVSPDGKHE